MNTNVVNHKDADTPEELARWIWGRFVGIPVAGKAWGQEYENLLDRIRRMDRSSFTKGLHEGADQMKGLSHVLPVVNPILGTCTAFGHSQYQHPKNSFCEAWQPLSEYAGGSQEGER